MIAALPSWADVDNLRTIILVALVVVVVVMLLVVRFVQKIMLKLTLLAVLGLVVGVGWWQRADLSDCAKTCSCRVLWQDVEIPTSKNPACAKTTTPAPTTTVKR